MATVRQSRCLIPSLLCPWLIFVALALVTVPMAISVHFKGYLNFNDFAPPDPHHDTSGIYVDHWKPEYAHFFSPPEVILAWLTYYTAWYPAHVFRGLSLYTKLYWPQEYSLHVWPWSLSTLADYVHLLIESLIGATLWYFTILPLVLLARISLAARNKNR